MVLWILGVSRGAATDSGRSLRGEDVWHGRVEFLRREMDRIAEKQTELVHTQSESLQGLMNMSEARIRTEISYIVDRYNVIEESMKEELDVTRKISKNMSNAVEELRALISLADASTTENNGIPTEVDVTSSKL